MKKYISHAMTELSYQYVHTETATNEARLDIKLVQKGLKS